MNVIILQYKFVLPRVVFRIFKRSLLNSGVFPGEWQLYSNGNRTWINTAVKIFLYIVSKKMTPLHNMVSLKDD